MQERTGEAAFAKRLVYAGNQLAPERSVADYEVCFVLFCDWRRDTHTDVRGSVHTVVCPLLQPRPHSSVQECTTVCTLHAHPHATCQTRTRNIIINPPPPPTTGHGTISPNLMQPCWALLLFVGTFGVVWPSEIAVVAAAV